MKTLVFACAVWTLGAMAARADLTVVQRVEGLGQDMENTSKFKDGKKRMDTSPGTSIILDLKTGEMINLMHVPKTYFKVSSALTQAAVASMQRKPDGPRSPAKPALTATGKQETIGGFAAQEYTCTVDQLKVTLWLTKALPDYEAALAEMNGALSEGPLGPPLPRRWH